MQKTNLMKNVCMFIDAVAIIYGGLFFYWMFFGIDSAVHNGLDYFFITINPMTWGTYFLGIMLLFHCYVFKNIWGRLVLWILYLFSTIISLVAVMGMYVWSDFLMYVPHLIIIPAAIFVMYKGREKV